MAARHLPLWMRHDRRARSCMLLLGDSDCVGRRWVRGRQRPMVHRMRGRMRQLHMHAQMGRILHPPLHCEQVDAIGAEHDMIDLAQATGIGRDRQRDGRIADFLFARMGMVRQLVDALQDLHVHRMPGVCGFRKQGRMLRLLECGKRVLAGDAVGAEVMGALEGFDGVGGVGAGVVVDG